MTSSDTTMSTLADRVLSDDTPSLVEIRIAAINDKYNFG
jgi:hypothetical protein